MKIVTEPSVYVTGRQTVNDADLNRFLADHGVAWESDSAVAAEVLTETAGRLCYLSYAKPRPGGNSAYIDHIKEVGHGSVLEHSVWNLIITGVSRALSHEFVRHRAGVSPSQLSQRYVDESVAEYVAPPDLQEEIAAAVFFQTISGEYERLGRETAAKHERGLSDFALMHATLLRDTVYGHMTWSEFFALENPGRQWLEAVSYSHRTYCSLSDYLTKKAARYQLAGTDARKFARQAARSVLPNATETKLFITANARALRHFLELRASRFADPEIRKLANKMYAVLLTESYTLFRDYEQTALPDGTFELNTPYRKV